MSQSFWWKKKSGQYDCNPFKYGPKVERSDITARSNNTAPMVLSCTVTFMHRDIHAQVRTCTGTFMHVHLHERAFSNNFGYLRFSLISLFTFCFFGFLNFSLCFRHFLSLFAICFCSFFYLLRFHAENRHKQVFVVEKWHKFSVFVGFCRFNATWTAHPTVYL